MAKKIEFPEIYRILYRGVRAAVGAGIGYALVVQPDWTNVESAYKALALAFITGFSVSFGKYMRDWLDSTFGLNEKSTISRVMPI